MTEKDPRKAEAPAKRNDVPVIHELHARGLASLGHLTTAEKFKSDAKSTDVKAQERFRKAYDSLGPGLQDVVYQTVALDKSLTATEKMLGWPARAGRLVLSLAMDRLETFYKENPDAK